MSASEFSSYCRDTRENEPLSRHTSFRTGGPARFFAVPTDEQELLALLDFAEKTQINHLVIGRGTNVLVSDKGYGGLVIKITYGNIRAVHDGIHADAGVSLKRLFETSLALGYTGLEFAAGIPGSLGGAIVMNAGAYGREMKDVIQSVRFYENGQVIETPAEHLDFRYRGSVFDRSERTILSAILSLPKGDVLESRRRQDDLMAARRRSQPLEYPSAGSTFKRPPGAFAGSLIENCGLRGASCGGAAVSTKHGGFVINRDNATSRDIHRLIHEVRRAVYEESGILLEPEVKFAGDFHD